MDPIIIPSIIIIVTILLGAWPWVVDFFSTRIFPWVRERVSPGLADVLCEFLAFADQGATALRRGIKNVWRTFQQHFMGSKMDVKKISATTAQSKTTTIVRDETGKFIQTTTEEVLDWDQLPGPIRSEMTRQGTKAASMDLKKTVEEKFRQQADKAGMAMELTL